MAALFVRFLVLLAICTWANPAFAGWNDDAWPASNKVSKAGTATSSTVYRVSGSTGLTNGAQTSWDWISTNYATISFANFQPTSGVFTAWAEKTNTYAQVWLPDLPVSILFTSAVSSNLCITNIVVGSVTNSLSNTCSLASITLTNWNYHAPDSTNTTTTIRSNAVGCAVCLATNQNTLITIDPCEVALVVSNSTRIETNCYSAVASLTNPGAVASWTWSNGTNALDCGLTRTPQLLAWDYTRLVNTNGLTTADTTNEDSTITTTTNGLSDFFPSTNWNLNVGMTWTFDSAVAAGERDEVLNVHPYPYQRFAPDVLPLNASHVWQNLPYWKGWLPNNASQFVITTLTNGAGTFDDYCSAPQTGMVWTSGQSGLCSDPVMDTNGCWYCSSPLYNTTNQWTNSISYRPPPQWSDTFYLDTNLTTVTTSTLQGPFPPRPLTVNEKLCTVLGLPHQWFECALTNWGVVEGWRVGQPLVYHTNIVQVVSNAAMVASYFDYTPDKHHANYDQGLGHIVTNRWQFNGGSDWARFLRIDYGAKDDGGQTGGWVIAAMPSAFDATNTDQVVTNSLTIMGNPYLSADVPYYSNGWNNVVTATFVPPVGIGFTVTIVDRPMVWPVRASNSVFYTRQVASVTNWPVALTNSYTVGFVSTQFSTATCSVTNNVCTTITNALTFPNSAQVVSTFDGTNWVSATTSNIPNIVTNLIICCGTNSVTNTVTALIGTQYVAVVTWNATNTASTTFNVIEQDWTSSNIWYVAAVYNSITNECSTCSQLLYTPNPGYDAYWVPTLYIVTNQTLLSMTSTNNMTITNATGIFTNWSVAEGSTEQAYDWDGVRTLLNLFTKVAVAIGWKNVDVTLPNRYGTNYVHEIADTNLFGSLRPTSVITDTLANASTSIHFTNLNYSANVAPWGASYATATNTDYRKDTWQSVGYQASAAIGDDVYTQLGMTYTGVLYYCIDGACPAGAGGGDCGVGFPPYLGSCFPDKQSAKDFIVAAGDTYLPDLGVDGEVWFSYCAPGGENALTNTVTDCNLREIVATSTNCFFGFSSSNGTFSISYVGDSLSFWHGSPPSNLNYCCTLSGTCFASVVTWTQTASNLTDSGTIAYSVGIPPAATNALSIYLAQPQQSSAGVLADISKSWACGREAYLIPNLPTITAAGWANTNILPVAASINSNATVLVTWTNTPTGDCTNKFAESMPQQWTYDVRAGFYPTGNSSNITMTVTNFAWSTTAVWKSPSVWAAAWDSTNNVGFYRRFSTATAQTNTFGLTNFLATTPLITNVEDGTSYGWGIGSGILIENWSVDGGIPHR